MSDPAPTLTQQIEAVEWAEACAASWARRDHLRRAKAMEIERGLEAAAETLKTLDFGRETLR